METFAHCQNEAFATHSAREPLTTSGKSPLLGMATAGRGAGNVCGKVCKHPVTAAYGPSLTVRGFLASHANEAAAQQGRHGNESLPPHWASTCRRAGATGSRPPKMAALASARAGYTRPALSAAHWPWRNAQSGTKGWSGLPMTATLPVMRAYHVACLQGTRPQSSLCGIVAPGRIAPRGEGVVALRPRQLGRRLRSLQPITVRGRRLRRNSRSPLSGGGDALHGRNLQQVCHRQAVRLTHEPRMAPVLLGCATAVRDRGVVAM